MAQSIHDFHDDPRNADIKIWINGALKHRVDATVSVFDSGFVLGDGVWEGLRVYEDSPPDRVLIHDAARPFASAELVTKVVAALDTSDAVVPAIAVANTLKAVDTGGIVKATVPRDGLFAAETPQGFRFAPIRDAHERAAASARKRSEDAPFQRSSEGGKCCPMSPSPRAPRTASVRACRTTSASE